MTITPILWLVAFLPALVALYFLKLKRRDVVVSSTFLWKKALEDFHVNAPFQRLRKSWLLLLQLLILAALIFALWRPRLSGEFASGRNLIVLLDNSASMNARESGGTRLELAKQEALNLAAGMDGADRMAFLVFSSRTTAVEPLTGDRSLLESRIRAVEPTSQPTDLAGALLVAHSLAETLARCEIHVIGDGCYGDLTRLPPEVKQRNLKFVAKGTPLANAGITEVDIRRGFDAERKTEVFALIESSGAPRGRLTATLEVDGELRDAREVELAGGSASVVFDVTGIADGIASVSIDAGDAFPVDDRAWVRIDPPRKLSVLVLGDSNAWLDLALKSAPGINHRRLTFAEYAKALEGARPGEEGEKLGAGVLIFDRRAPDGEPPLPAIYIGCLPSLPASLANPEMKKLPAVIDWDRGHPVNRFIVFTDLYLEESRVFRTAPEYKSLVDSDGGSIAGVVAYRSAGRPPLPVLLVGFDILKSDWPRGHYSFPIFFSNAVEWLGSALAGSRPARSRTGEPLVHHPGPAAGSGVNAVFRSPSGQDLPAAREAGGAFVLAAAAETGVYEVRAGGTAAGKFPVNLADAKESNLVPGAAIDLGDFEIPVTAASEERARHLWKWFALLALGLVLLEWRVYLSRAFGRG